LEKRAKEFIANLGIEPGLPINIRAYEYSRAIEPRLVQLQDSLFEEWKRILAHGAVVLPSSLAKDRPIERDLLKSIKTMFETAALWESATMADYIIELGAKRRMRERVAGLRGRTYLLVGLLHTLRGAKGGGNMAKRSETYGLPDASQFRTDEYKRAAKWFEDAASLLEVSNPELKIAAELARKKADQEALLAEKEQRASEVGIDGDGHERQREESEHPRSAHKKSTSRLCAAPRRRAVFCMYPCLGCIF